MRRFFALWAVFLLSISLYAQTRVVKGMVVGEDDAPLSGVEIYTTKGEKTTTGKDGKFAFFVSLQSNFIFFVHPDYLEMRKEIDASFLLVRMRMNKEEKARKAKIKREADNQSADKAYDERFKNKGFEHNVDISYSYQLSKGDVAFAHSGFRDYGSTHPIEMDYTLSYKFNRLVSVGVGVGVLYHLKSVSITGDNYISTYSSFREKQIDVPVFANVKIRMLRSNVRPLINMQGGYYCMSGVFYGEAGLGCEYRVTKGLALQLTASVRTCPWPNFSEEMRFAKYVMSISPCIKLGVTF